MRLLKKTLSMLLVTLLSLSCLGATAYAAGDGAVASAPRAVTAEESEVRLVSTAQPGETDPNGFSPYVFRVSDSGVSAMVKVARPQVLRDAVPVISGGNATELSLGNTTEIVLGNTTELSLVNTTEIVLGNATDLSLGNTTEIVPGNATQINVGNITPVVYQPEIVSVSVDETGDILGFTVKHRTQNLDADQYKVTFYDETSPILAQTVARAEAGIVNENSTELVSLSVSANSYYALEIKSLTVTDVINATTSQSDPYAISLGLNATQLAERTPTGLQLDSAASNGTHVIFNVSWDARDDVGYYELLGYVNSTSIVSSPWTIDNGTSSGVHSYTVQGGRCSYENFAVEILGENATQVGSDGILGVKEGDTVRIALSAAVGRYWQETPAANVYYTYGESAPAAPIQLNANNTLIQLDQESYVFNGTAVNPGVTVIYLGSDENRTLEKGTDYWVSLSNNTAVGAGLVIVGGQGGYTGEVAKEFSIVSGENATQTLTKPVILNAELSPVGNNSAALYVRFSLDAANPVDYGVYLINGTKGILGKLMLEANDTLVVAETGGNKIIDTTMKLFTDAASLPKERYLLVGVTVDTPQGYEWLESDPYTLPVETEIAPIQLNATNTLIQLDQESYVFNGTAVNPGVTVIYLGSDENRTLEKGTDYWVSLSNNTAVGAGLVIVGGQGGYTGEVTKGFPIVSGENATSGGNATAVTYVTVSFDTQGGSTIDPVTVEKGQKVTRPADPTRENNVFLAWYPAGDDSKPFDFNTAVQGNMTLCAKWLSMGYVLVGQGNGTLVNATLTYTEGSDAFTFTIKQSVGVDDSFKHFIGVSRNGKMLTNSTDYIAREGSTIITLTKSYMNKLKPGDYEFKVHFDNGEVTVKLHVKKAAGNATANTGDASAIGLWTTVTLLSGAGLLLLLGEEKKRRGKARRLG